MELREELIQNIAKNFLKDLTESARPFTEVNDRIDFIGTLIDYLKGVYYHEPSCDEYNYAGNPFDEDEFLETRLLEKHRDKMIPFVKTRLQYYFAKDEFNQSQLFEKLNINEALFSYDEYQSYISRLFAILRQIKENLFLIPAQSSPTEKDQAQKLLENSNELVKQGFKSQSKEYTRSRQILLFYFMLKLMGISRNDTAVTKLAGFGHALFCWPTDDINNNDVYKMLLQAPYLKKNEKTLLKDLEFVKKQFENIEHEAGIILIQKEIDSIKRK